MRWLETVYQLCDKYRDTRSDGWFLVDDFMQVVAIVILYLLFIGYAPAFMEKRQALGLRWFIIPYNLCMVLLSCFLTYETFTVAWLSNYSLACQPVDYSNSALSLRMLNVSYLFFLSKVIELLDTVFFILRKKQSQVTLLHVYHHSTIPLLMYCGPRFVGGGQGFITAGCNSFVHVVMYSYYTLAAIGPHMQKYLWWKKHLTKLQMVQFVILISHATVGLYVDCPYPSTVSWAFVIFTFSHLFLFSHFYYASYISRVRSQQRPSTALNGHAVCDTEPPKQEPSFSEPIMTRKRSRRPIQNN